MIITVAKSTEFIIKCSQQEIDVLYDALVEDQNNGCSAINRKIRATLCEALKEANR